MVGCLFQNSNVTFSFRSHIHSFKMHIQYSIRDVQFSFKIFMQSRLFIIQLKLIIHRFRGCDHIICACVSCINAHVYTNAWLPILRRRHQHLYTCFHYHNDTTPLFSLATPTCGCVHDKCLWFYCIRCGDCICMHILYIFLTWIK